MALTNRDVVQRYLDHIALHREPLERLSGGTVHVREGALVYRRTAGNARSRFDQVVLAEIHPRRGLCLLNGDGFPDQSATQNQTMVRRNITHRFMGGGVKFRQIVIIPFLALTAAGVNRTTIRPIHVVADETELVYHKVFDEFPPLEEWTVEDLPNQPQRRLTISRGGTQIAWGQQAITSRYFDVDGRQVGRYEYGNRPVRSEHDYHGAFRPLHDRLTTRTPDNTPVNVFRLTEPMRRQMLQNIDVQNLRVAQGGFGEIVRAELPPADDCWWYEERVHHLGSCLFSAEDESGRRHKYVSAFDEDEPNRMYFLAQLPDRSGADTYREAIEALAPELVKEARRQGRTVFRQGDVFAIETNLSDDDVYTLARTRVMRHIALWGLNTANGRQQVVPLDEQPVVPAHHLREDIECPTCGGHTLSVGWGPECRRALSIYNTGHTATEVVVSQDGTTYIGGVMYHDPYIQEPGRAPEHAPVELTADKWFVAVRNTVPRRRQRREVVEEVEVQVR